MSDDCEAWKARWMVLIKCRDCGEVYECTNPSLSLDRVGGFNRMFVAGGPETCPECRNLRVAK